MIVVLMGVAGSGKSTVGKVIADRLGWHFYEGDDFHSEANRAKMRGGEPLTDQDRRQWLDALANLISNCLREHENAVLACSALKRSYRSRLGINGVDVRLAYLRGSPALIRRRLAARHGHFFNPALLGSQFEALEEPSGAISVGINGTPEQIADVIISALPVEGPWP